MVLIQGLLAFLARSVGRILSAMFGWAVVVLFGPRRGMQQNALSLAVAAAAAWLILVLGIFFPKLATFFLALVPLPESTPTGLLRAVWIVLSLAVPLSMGFLLRRFARSNAGTTAAGRVLSGFPATIGVAAAFLVVAIVSPVRKLFSLARRRDEAQVPLIVTGDAYEDVASRIERWLQAARVDVKRGPAPWYVSAPARALRFLGGRMFQDQIPERLAYLAGPELEILINPNGVTIRGTKPMVVRARGLLTEAVAWSAAYQTLDAKAQGIEDRLTRLYFVSLDEDPTSASLAKNARHRETLRSIGRDLLATDVPFDDWQVLYRQALQLSRALWGEVPLLSQARKSEARSGAAPQSPEGDAAPTRTGLRTAGRSMA